MTNQPAANKLAARPTTNRLDAPVIGRRSEVDGAASSLNSVSLTMFGAGVLASSRASSGDSTKICGWIASTSGTSAAASVVEVSMTTT